MKKTFIYRNASFVARCGNSKSYVLLGKLATLLGFYKKKPDFFPFLPGKNWEKIHKSLNCSLIKLEKVNLLISMTLVSLK